MISIEDFEKVDMRAGVIVDVQDFTRARKPSYKARIDFGPEIGERWSAMQATNYTKETLVGMEVICVVNLPPRNIAGFMSEVLTLGVKQADGKLSLLTPSLPAQIGTRVY